MNHHANGLRGLAKSPHLYRQDVELVTAAADELDRLTADLNAIRQSTMAWAASPGTVAWSLPELVETLLNERATMFTAVMAYASTAHRLPFWDTDGKPTGLGSRAVVAAVINIAEDRDRLRAMQDEILAELTAIRDGIGPNGWSRDRIWQRVEYHEGPDSKMRRLVSLFYPSTDGYRCSIITWTADGTRTEDSRELGQQRGWVAAMHAADAMATKLDAEDAG